MAVFYQTYRPQTWNEVVGQDHVITPLINAIKLGKLPHALLFTGPRGTGKTTTARIVAKAVNCLNPDTETKAPCCTCQNCKQIAAGNYMDLLEIDAASNRGIDDIRQLRETVALAPANGKFRIYIIDEVHMLTNEAFNALLKTLEEPPATALFMLATTELEKVPDTIISRCQVHNLRPLHSDEVIKRLAEVCAKEGYKAEEEALQLIAKVTQGGMRDSLGILEQSSLAAGGNPITKKIVYEILGKRHQEIIPCLVAEIINKNDIGIMTLIEAEATNGTDFKTIFPEMLEYLHDILHAKYGEENPPDVLEQAKLFQIDHLLYTIDLFEEGFSKMRYNPNPRLLLETICIKSCRPIATLEGLRSALEIIDKGLRTTYTSVAKSEKILSMIVGAMQKKQVS